ncbi:MAG: DNA repair protein RecO [Candidatus Zixiibacteriota bacterium]
MPQVKSEGIILRSVNWKENSKIVTIFTNNAGKISVIDRGGRSLKSKRGRLMNFSRLELNYFKSDKSGMGYISEADPLEVFTFEREGTLGRLTFGSAVLELINDLVPEEEPVEGLYHLTLDYFRLIDRAAKSAITSIFIAYFLKLLSFLGYRPNFAGCIGCGTEADKTAVNNFNGSLNHNFSPERGGLVCGACQIGGEYYIRLSSARLAQIYSLQTSSLSEAANIKAGFVEAEEIIELLKGFLKYQTDTRDLKSLKFLEKLKNANL